MTKKLLLNNSEPEEQNRDLEKKIPESVHKDRGPPQKWKTLLSLRSSCRRGQQPHAVVSLCLTEARIVDYFVVGRQHFATLHECGGGLCGCDSVSGIAKVRVEDLGVQKRKVCVGHHSVSPVVEEQRASVDNIIQDLRTLPVRGT